YAGYCITLILRKLAAKGLLTYLNDDLDLHRGTQWQLRNTDGGAGMLASLTENLTEDVARSVDDARLAAETGGGGNVARDLHDAFDVLQSDLCSGGRHSVEHGDASQFVGLFRADLGSRVGADLPDEAELRQLTVDKWQLTGGVDDVAAADGGDVRRDGGRNGRQLDTELVEPGWNLRLGHD